MSSSTFQPNFHTNIGNAVPGTDYDNLSPEELAKLINEAHKLKTGHSGRLAPSPPPPAKRHADLSSVLGGLNA